MNLKILCGSFEATTKPYQNDKTNRIKIGQEIEEKLLVVFFVDFE